jgi:hypothetical protein
MFGAATVLILALSAIQALRGTRSDKPPAVAASGLAAPYADAIHARNSELARCMAAHPEPLPEGTQAVLRIGVDGHPRHVSFTPGQVERSALGNCLRDVLATAVFPVGDTERELALAVDK